MMRAWKYKRLTPNVLSQRLDLIESKDIVDLVGKSVEYIRLMLLRTPYQSALQALGNQQRDVATIENVLVQKYITTCEVIKEHSPTNIRFLLSTMLKKFEVDNIIAILRAQWAGLSVPEAMKFITPVGGMDEARCQSILETAASASDVVERLADVEYGPVLKNAMAGQRESEGLQFLEASLNKHLYNEIYKALSKLRGRDKKIAATVLGMEIDSKNIILIVRSLSMKIAKDQVKRYLLPTSQVFSEKELDTAIGAKDIPSSIESLLAVAQRRPARDYQDMLTDLLSEYQATQSLARIEVILDRNLLKTSLRMLKRYTPYFNIGLLLAFLNAKWFEVRNIRAILRGAEGGLHPETIRSVLILPA